MWWCSRLTSPPDPAARFWTCFGFMTTVASSQKTTGELPAASPKTRAAWCSALCRRCDADGRPGGTCRVLQITELVRECLQQRDANCTILPAPPETCDLDSTATILQRCACKDATAVSPLRKILSNKRKGSSSTGSLEVSSESDEFGSPENVQVGTPSPPQLLLGTFKDLLWCD